MNDDRRSQGRHGVKFFGGEHRNAYAPVTGWLNRHRWIPVNRNSANQVHWIIEQAQWALSPSGEFALNSKSAARSDRVAGMAFRSERFSGSCRHRQNPRRRSIRVHYEENLALQVDFDMGGAGFGRRRARGNAQRLKLFGGEAARSRTLFDLLKRDQRVTQSFVRRAVDTSGPIVKVRESLFGLTDFFRAHSGRTPPRPLSFPGRGSHQLRRIGSRQICKALRRSDESTRAALVRGSRSRSAKREQRGAGPDSGAPGARLCLTTLCLTTQ